MNYVTERDDTEDDVSSAGQAERCVMLEQSEDADATGKIVKPIPLDDDVAKKAKATGDIEKENWQHNQ